MGSVRLTVQQMFREVRIDSDWSFAEYSRADTTKWTHGYHRYPAKFIPQLVEKLFDEYLPKSGGLHINDPFFGSGTTIVSAISRGFRASGTDINNVAYLMALAKSTPIEPNILENKTRKFLVDIKPTLSSNVFPESYFDKLTEKNLQRLNYWFPEANKIELGRILTIILKEPDSTIKRFLLTAFSHILKSCSIWLQRSTKPTRDKTKIPRDPYILMKHHLKKMVKGNSDFYHQVPEYVRDHINDYLNITLNDACKQSVDGSSVDLIVTSSPYVTSYEYADLHQLSTLWLGFADDYREYRQSFIGSGHRKNSSKNPQSEIAGEIVSELSDRNEKTAQEVREFFCDMEDVFRESHRILKPDGKCCFVIGNTTLKGVEILNAQAFTESLILCGFQIDRIIKRRIPFKILPQTRNKSTGRFSSRKDATLEAYPTEYILIGVKDR